MGGPRSKSEAGVPTSGARELLKSFERLFCLILWKFSASSLCRRYPCAKVFAPMAETERSMLNAALLVEGGGEALLLFKMTIFLKALRTAKIAEVGCSAKSRPQCACKDSSALEGEQLANSNLPAFGYRMQPAATFKSTVSADRITRPRRLPLCTVVMSWPRT